MAKYTKQKIRNNKRKGRNSFISRRVKELKLQNKNAVRINERLRELNQKARETMVKYNIA